MLTDQPGYTQSSCLVLGSAPSGWHSSTKAASPQWSASILLPSSWSVALALHQQNSWSIRDFSGIMGYHRYQWNMGNTGNEWDVNRKSMGYVWYWYIYIYINHPPCLCHWDISLSTKSLQRGQELDVVLGHDVHSLQGSKLILESNGKATSMLRDSKTKFPRIPDKLKKNTEIDHDYYSLLGYTTLMMSHWDHWLNNLYRNITTPGSNFCPETAATPAAQKPQGLQGPPTRNLENCLTQRQSLGA